MGVGVYPPVTDEESEHGATTPLSEAVGMPSLFVG
jgi:hypothetical protein